MKFTTEIWCFRPSPKSTQLEYGCSALSLVCRWISLRKLFSDGTPASRARVMLIVGRSSGRPSRLLRSASATNSSSSLPIWSDMPMAIAPAACSGVYVPVPFL
jgi:hypothetical protein